MARTKAQERTPQKTYGGQTHRGDLGEQRAAAILRQEGYSVELSPLHPHGTADIIARKGKTVRKIQVKRITSRTFATPAAARNRMAGKPFNLKKLPPGYELWVFDQKGNLYRFKK